MMNSSLMMPSTELKRMSDDVVFLSRDELGLARPNSISRRVNFNSGGVMVHWGGPAQGVTTLSQAVKKWKSWQLYHMNTKGWADIAYNMGFWRNYVFAGRGAAVRSAANGTSDANTRYAAVAWIGGQGEMLNELDYRTLGTIVEELRKIHVGNEVRPHSAVRQTTCPGPDLKAWALSANNSTNLGARPLPPISRPTPTQQGWTEKLVNNLPTRSRRTDLGRVDTYDARIQGLLTAVGYLPLQKNINDRGQLDGKFGPSTEQSVQRFQRSNGLAPDGVVGPKTWAELLGA